MRLFRRIGFAVVLTAGLTGPAFAQQGTSGWDPARVQLSRKDLEDLLARFEQTQKSQAYSAGLRSRARAEAALIRERLQDGDFQVGDRIQLVVEGHPQLSDTFMVVSGQKVVLPALGDIALNGVLRSELEGYLRDQIAKYIVDPTVHARSLIRIAVFGDVAKPGFYTIPSDMILSDALMVAGGPAGNADLDKLRIERGDRRIWDGERMQEALRNGRTLDQLSLRAGDQIVVPARSGVNLLTYLQVAVPLATLVFYFVNR